MTAGPPDEGLAETFLEIVARSDDKVIRTNVDPRDIRHMAQALLNRRAAARRAPPPEGTTHYAGCWRAHHACAVARIEEVRGKVEGLPRLRALIASPGLEDQEFVGLDAVLALLPHEGENND